MSKLKPCPFCEGKAKLSTRQLRFIGQNYLGDKKIRMGAQVVCNRCHARGSLYMADVINPYNKNLKDAGFDWIKESAIKAWNRRAE